MFRSLRKLILIALAAAAGAVIGRWVAEARARVDEGEDPLAIDLRDVNVRPQDFVPGMVAAFRVGEPPWSWLHIPAWAAAFAMNFGTSVVGGDFDRLRQAFEDRALSALGLQPEVEIEDVPQTPPDGPFAHTPPAPAASEAPPAPAAPPVPTPAPPVEAVEPDRTAVPPRERSVWTTENAAPTARGNGTPPEAELPGFTPLSD